MLVHGCFYAIWHCLGGYATIIARDDDANACAHAFVVASPIGEVNKKNNTCCYRDGNERELPTFGRQMTRSRSLHGNDSPVTKDPYGFTWMTKKKKARKKRRGRRHACAR